MKSPRNVDLSAYMAAWMARLKPPRPVRISVDIDPYSFMWGACVCCQRNRKVIKS